MSERPSRLRRALRAVAVDVGLLRRRRDYRLLVGGQFVSLAGSELMLGAVPFRTYALTPPAPDAPPPSWRSIVEGVRFAGSRQELLGTYLVDSERDVLRDDARAVPGAVAGLRRRVRARAHVCGAGRGSGDRGAGERLDAAGAPPRSRWRRPAGAR